MRRLLPLLAVALFCAVPMIAHGDRTDRPSDAPPPSVGDCGGDRVSGVWRARNSSRGWTWITTLTIRRAAGGALSGTISGTWWTVGARRPPPPCLPGQSAYRVRQPAVGRVDGLRVEFRGTSYQTESICGPPQGYNPDHFTGTIDDGAPIFRTVNNDGDNAVNNPYLFRRVRCR